MLDTQDTNKGGKMKLQSVLKNVPHYLRVEIMKYKTKPCAHKIRWVAREPVAGKKYGWGGNLKLEDSKSADFYVDRNDPYDTRVVEIEMENYQLKRHIKHLEENEADYLKLKAEYEKTAPLVEAIQKLKHFFKEN